MTDAWRRFGRLPAAPVVGVYFTVALAMALALGDAATWVGVGLTALFVLYCVARPAEGVNVFFIAAAPGALATLAHDIVGTPRWLGVVLVPFALLALHRIDEMEAAT